MSAIAPGLPATAARHHGHYAGFNAATGFAAHVLPSGGAELVIFGVGFHAGDAVTISVFGSQSVSASDKDGWLSARVADTGRAYG